MTAMRRLTHGQKLVREKSTLDEPFGCLHRLRSAELLLCISLLNRANKSKQG